MTRSPLPSMNFDGKRIKMFTALFLENIIAKHGDCLLILAHSMYTLLYFQFIKNLLICSYDFKNTSDKK